MCRFRWQRTLSRVGIAIQNGLVKKIVSGGQTGVDRAALDVALVYGIPCGGWCPAGRRAADGPIADRYPLTETPSEDYAQRTSWNVRDTDGTLIIAPSPLIGGTRLTRLLAEQMGKPLLVIDPSGPIDTAAFQRWIEVHAIRILNVAGPRENRPPRVYTRARAVLTKLLTLTG